MSQDLTFITNEGSQNLRERFKELIKDTDFFDCLVGYFYVSGFHSIYKPLESTIKVRILIGISTNKQTYGLLGEAKSSQGALQFSHAETKEQLGVEVEKARRHKDDDDMEVSHCRCQ